MGTVVPIHLSIAGYLGPCVAHMPSAAIPSIERLERVLGADALERLACWLGVVARVVRVALVVTGDDGLLPWVLFQRGVTTL